MENSKEHIDEMKYIAEETKDEINGILGSLFFAVKSFEFILDRIKELEQKINWGFYLEGEYYGKSKKATWWR